MVALSMIGVSPSDTVILDEILFLGSVSTGCGVHVLFGDRTDLLHVQTSTSPTSDGSKSSDGFDGCGAVLLPH